MGPVHGERGLAGTGHPVDDGDGGGGGGAGGGQQCVGAVEFGAAAGERREVRRQLRRTYFGTPRRTWRVHDAGDGPGQNLGVQGPQRRPRFDAEFVDQGAARPRIDLQRVRLPSAPVQGDEQQFAHRLAQRLGVPKSEQLRHHRLVPAEFQLRPQGGLQRVQPPLGQIRPRRLGERAGHSGQRGTGPVGQRGAQQPEGGFRLAGQAMALGPRHRARAVGEVGGEHVVPQGVPVPGRDQDPERLRLAPLGLQQLAQPGGVRTQHRHRARRRLCPPDPVDEVGHGDRVSAAQQQHRENGALLGGAQRQFPGTAPGPQRAEQGEPEGL